MIQEVRVAQHVYAKANERYGEIRSPEGAPSEYDFVSGPLAAAVFAFRDFDQLRSDVLPSVRSYTVVDPFFGPVVFVGVLLANGAVEISDFEDDPDYWRLISDDPG